jgi:hypothetical protein
VYLNFKSEFLPRLRNAAYNIPIINREGDTKNTYNLLARMSTDGTIILKRIFQKQSWKCGLDPRVLNSVLNTCHLQVSFSTAYVSGN